MAVLLHPMLGEHALTTDIRDALGSSLDLQRMLSSAYPLLTRIVAADHGALCVSSAERPEGYDFATVDLPPVWFSGYDEMAPYDFVRNAVAARPNIVLCDADMIGRSELEASAMYVRARSIGLPIEHVLAVRLDGDGWHGGVMLYRSGRMPFSDDDRDRLQGLVPSFAQALGNCRTFGETARLLQQKSRSVSLLDAVLRHKGTEAVVIAPSGAELTRTGAATALLEAWFTAVERPHGGLPTPVAEHLASAARRCEEGRVPLAFVRRGSTTDLRVSFIPHDEASGRFWALLFEETPHLARVPGAWREILTAREIEITERVLTGWDNALIAQNLGCSTATVKKHLQRVFDKLGASSRSALCWLAASQT